MEYQVFFPIPGCVTVTFMQLAEKFLKHVLLKLAVLFIITVVNYV